MQSGQLQTLSDQLTRANVLLCFNGPFSHSLIEEFGKALRAYLTVNETDKGSVSDVFSVYIEQAQNVKNYTTSYFPAEVGGLLQRGILAIAREHDGYVISAGNFVRSEHVEPLRARLQSVVNADKDSLKAMYKRQLRAERSEDSSGAGLGLLSMARVASAPLSFHFEPSSEHHAHTYFSLSVQV
ncbi:MAG: SiaB family protein kinase [Deltaproteobacteria bacterium]|nr:SiaB family protein kinase [Deltaproteobacteria bacterium]